MTKSVIPGNSAVRWLRSFGSETILYVAAALSMVAAMIHLWAVPEHLEEWWGYGAFFLLVAAVQGSYGLALLRWPTRRLLLAGIAGNLAVVSFYISTRTAGIPFFGPHAWNIHPVGTLDLVCVSAELVLVAALVVYTGLVSDAGRYLALGAAQALGVGLVLHLSHPGMHGTPGVNPALQLFEDSILGTPLSVLALLLTSPLARRLAEYLQAGDLASRVTWALACAAAYALAGIPANGFAARHAVAGSFAEQAARDAGVTLGFGFVLLLAVATVRQLATVRGMHRGFGLWRPRFAAVLVGGLASLAVVVGPSVFGNLAPSSKAIAASQTCSSASYDRSYDVAAIDVEVPYNRWGGSDPHGQVYVLQGDKKAVKNWSTPLAANAADDPAGNRRLRPRPLVLRANAGECVKVDFTNELDDLGEDGLPNNPRASIKVYGPSYNAQTSDGSAVGFNADTTVPNKDNPTTRRKENRISYFWKAPGKEGIFSFRDQGALSGSEANSGSTSHGLYGAFVVEPAGSTWLDPETGDALYAGVRDHNRITKQSGDPYIDADIVSANRKAFRESVQVSQDELPGGQGFSFNYGAEPAFNRIATNPAGEGNTEQSAPDAVGEETSLSSWTYGDPALIKLASGPGPWLPEPDGKGGRISREDCGLATSCYVSNVTHTYKGDPSKVRFIHAGVKETHVFHMHAHQWRAEPGDGKESTTIDSQTYGPGEGFTADLLFGSGSKAGSIGDSIFHCHLYPHFAEGFWALFRTHDVLEDGSGKTPDGVNVRSLKPLPDRTAQPQPTQMNPGYPRFIPGEFGWRAPQPPGGISEPSGIPDLPNTLAREDLRPADRVVAGRPLDATLDPADPVERELAEKLAVEKAVQERHYGSRTPKPGAPLTDPCPTGSREITYNVSVIQTDITYNEAGWHDRQARILVPNEDVDDILAGKKSPEPLFIRANAGDCVNFNLTNRLPNWFGGDEFQQLAQTNMAGEHIHLVKYDVLGSDGASNGWNYQQAAFSRDQAAFNENRDPNNDIENCDWKGCRIPEPASWDPATAGAQPGQTIHERWYADSELRTVFTHDHHFAALEQNHGLFGALIIEPRGMDFRNPKTGAYYQPVNSAANGSVCGAKCNASAVGTAMDVIGPGAGDDFREFGLAVQDFVSLHKAGPDGAPVAPPAEPEPFPSGDPGVMAINYKNAPFSLRETDRNGQPADPAHVFSSTVHGDPATPILKAYSEDPVRVRLIQGSQEEQHVFTMNGIRWRQEPKDPESPLVNAQPIGVSEAFNFEVPRITCGAGDETCAGDYLYSGTSTDDMYLGVWGLLRARGNEVNSLLPLPDNQLPARGTATRSTSALAPPESNSPGTPCPAGVPVKKYGVVAMQAKLTYNKDGDNDPHGLIYALARDEEAIRNGDKRPEPLVLRANEGDCIEVTLTNKLSASWLRAHGNAGTNGDPTLPTEATRGSRAGLRVSLHPQLVKYDVRGSDGTAVGFNRDQTVAPGDSRLYRWYADDVSPGELGTVNLTDFGDVRGHRHHGLFAALNIEPKGSTYLDPETGRKIRTGTSAIIRVPKAPDFREFTTFFQDGLNMHDKTGVPIEDPLDHPPTPEEPFPEGLDAEDMGEKGFNYGSSPFEHRLSAVDGSDPAHPPAHGSRELARVFSSKIHGDPDTPIFRAYAGDRVRIRVVQGSDKPRQHSFQVSGHSWRAQPKDPGSTIVGTQGGISVGGALNIHLNSAGGPDGYPGDYRYGCGVGFHHLSGGLWGIMRVYPKPPAVSALDPTPIGRVDNPYAGGHPILPLNVTATAPVRSGLSLSPDPRVVRLGKSTTLSGRLTSGGRGLAHKRVILEQRPIGTKGFSKLGTAHKTNARGSFSFARIRPKKTTDYRARFAGDKRANILASKSPVRRVVVRR